MKKTAYVLVDDFMHPATRVLPAIRKIFDLTKWHVCVLTSFDSICRFEGSPDLIIVMKDGVENWRMETENWYESPFAYRIASFVKKNGCGYIAIHSGLDHIPEHHPIRNELLQGHVFVEQSKPPFFNNMLFPAPDVNPYGCFDSVTVIIQNSEHPLMNDMQDFTLTDEQYRVDLIPNNTVTVLASTHSRAGESIGCWVNECGIGRVCGISIGHLRESLESTPVVTLLRNAVQWCGKEI